MFPPHWRHVTITAACAGAHKGVPVHPDDPKGVPPGLRLPATLRCPHASGTIPRPGTRTRAQATSQVTSGAPMTTEVPPNHAPSNDGHFGCLAHVKACPHEKKGATSHTPSMLSLTPNDMSGCHQYTPNPNEQAQSHRGLARCLRMRSPPLLSEPGRAGPVTTKDTPRHASPPSAHLEPSDAACMTRGPMCTHLTDPWLSDSTPLHHDANTPYRRTCPSTPEDPWRTRHHCPP